MPIHTSLNSRTSTPTRRRPIRRSSQASRLCLESLEDRCLLSFSPAVNYPVGNSPLAVVTGDFNGDGRLDLVVANSFGSTVSVLLGNANGTFQPSQNSSTGTSTQSMAVGDFNADGKLDLAMTTGLDVRVLLGNGNGTFQPPSTFRIASDNPLSVAVGDFNGDGKLDLGVTSDIYVLDGGYYQFYGHYEGRANVMLGNGDGSFSAPHTTALDIGPPVPVAVTDVNADGKLDLVTADIDTGKVSVLLGDGNGNLLGPSDFNAGGPHGAIAAGDVNGDSHVDIVTANGYSQDISVLLGDSARGFGAAQSYAASVVMYPKSVVLADFNHDTHLDVATANYNGVSLLWGKGDGTFQSAQNFPDGSVPTSVAVGDFNGDGWSDMAVVNYSSNDVSVLINAADWSTTPQASSFAVTGFPSPTTAGAADTFTVRAKNADGTMATGYTGTVHFTSSDGQAGLPTDYTFAAADAGVHTFSATLKTAGAQSITATDTTTASLTGSEVNITVNAAAASHLDVGAPAGSTAGNAFSLMLTARDPYNNIAGGYRGTVHFTSTDGQASLPGDYTFTAADAGLHAFNSGVILKTAGSQTVTATDTTAAAVTGNASVVVSPAAARTMTVAGFPSPTTAGVAGSFTVSLKDPYGNIARGYTGTVRFTSSDGKAALPANYTFTAADAGVHTFRATLKTAGTQSITARDTTNVALSGSEGSITVRPAAASRFLMSAPAGVRSGVAFGLTLTVQDGYGNAVTGYTGTVHITSADGLASLPANYTFTGANMGVHTFTGLVLRKKCMQKITIADTRTGALSGSVTEIVL